MSWDRNTRAKKLNRKQRRFLTLLSIIVSLLFVVILSIGEGFNWQGGLDFATKIANTVLNDEEKRTVWDGMSDDGKAVIRRHLPAQE